ncbi:hypothetical protein Bbelb_105830 [Branchiostoma belcheri]|nr:hypothetical protein Bbelb_105830 [Branchiostoma belcheri]
MWSLTTTDTCWLDTVAEERLSEDLQNANFLGEKHTKTSVCCFHQSLIDSLCKATDKPSTSCSILATDFSKAFDRVHHSTVITKLIHKGLRPELLPWICDFITRRRQVVRYRGALSGWEYLSCGVAQGTLLGPVLFLVLIDDACHDANSPVWKYVDDMNLLETRSLNQPSSLQNDLDDLNTWSKRNHMLLNSSVYLRRALD